MSIQSLDQYLKEFFHNEKTKLLKNYPGLNLHRLRQDLSLHAFLHGMDSEELFDFPYLPSRTNPLTLFFNKLRDGVPLEYITGYAYFYRSIFKVTKDVLIPRSETEILVELASEEILKNYKRKTCRVADIGTGTGAIALSLMTYEGVTLDMVASDISTKALKLARENYFNQTFALPKGHRLQFIESDRLKNIPGEFNLILSNPPYIKKSLDFDTVHEQVAKYEPHLALFLEDAVYTAWFEEFFTEIYNKLLPEGISFIEGHENHLEELKGLALAIGFKEAIVIRDYTNRNRFLKLKK